MNSPRTMHRLIERGWCIQQVAEHNGVDVLGVIKTIGQVSLQTMDLPVVVFAQRKPCEAKEYDPYEDDDRTRPAVPYRAENVAPYPRDWYVRRILVDMIKRRYSEPERIPYDESFESVEVNEGAVVFLIQRIERESR